MKVNLSENVFDLLSKIDLDEDLDPRIDGEVLLYEDNEFSKTPAEADKYRTTTEEVLGFDLNGNQVQYLATNWPAFYHNAKKYANMKDQIISFLREDGLGDNIPEATESQIVIPDNIDDDIDYYEEPNADVLRPVNNQNQVVSNQFSPLQVQSWDTPKQSNDGPQDTLSEINDMANEQVDVDEFDDVDDDMINQILNSANK